MEFRQWETHLNYISSYELIAKHIQTSLCHSVPFDLRTAYHNWHHTALNTHLSKLTVTFLM